MRINARRGTSIAGTKTEEERGFLLVAMLAVEVLSVVASRLVPAMVLGLVALVRFVAVLFGERLVMLL